MKKKFNYIFLFIIIFIVFFTINKFLFEKKIENSNYQNAIFNIYSQNNINLENNLWLKWETEKYKKVKEEHIIWKWFFINKSWEFLSSKHIFDNNLSSFYVKINNQKFSIKILDKNKNKDIILWKINYKNKNYLSINFTKHDYLSYENQKIYTYKINKEDLAPWIQINWKILKLNQNISELNLKNLIQTNIKLSPWDSWSPIFNYSTNTIIWIATAIKKSENISYFTSTKNLWF